ncbi:hypothetical protein GOODEAATRI_032084 [Goodea atripinnis]|uniref:Uncharacterized protein n=1 Tax=Goodea atripinnis TaxID=208336 RepID=A0ABV0N5Z5_9TELE
MSSSRPGSARETPCTMGSERYWEVGQLFQASTTALRYAIELIMLYNITGPGEGKSYANKVLTYKFSRVKGCVGTLTSITPQAYKQKRSFCVVIINDAHY